MRNRSLKRTEKLQVMLDGTELEAIEDWRFKNRMPTRAAAIRELLRRGLNSDLEEKTIQAKSANSHKE